MKWETVRGWIEWELVQKKRALLNDQPMENTQKLRVQIRLLQEILDLKEEDIERDVLRELQAEYDRED